jgi:Ran-binding protein 9/10
MNDNYRRRLSYATVASGASPQPVPRSGHLGHLASTTYDNSYPPQYQSESRSAWRQSNYEQDMSSPGVSYHKRPSYPAYSRRFNNPPGMSAPIPGYGPMLEPDYLRESRYVAKLKAEQTARVRRERQTTTGAISNPASLSSSAANNNLPRIAPSHRGMTYDVIESNPPKDEDELMPLPSRWSDQDKYPGLDISNNGLDVRYSGAASKADIEAASVRADFPMTPACGMYYFEVTINSKSKDSAIAIGFSTAEASLERLPGWETHSWGYHGDDGKVFSGEHSGRSYGPMFSANDVVGCGFDFKLGQAFFTINGRDLDVCFRDLKNLRPFPTIGMKKYSGASVSVNFGQRPFVFDIREKMAVAKDTVHEEISRVKTASLSPGHDETSLIQALVAQYLAHDGYVDTARFFNEELARERNALSGTPSIPSAAAEPAEDDEAVYRQSKIALRKPVFMLIEKQKSEKQSWKATSTKP